MPLSVYNTASRKKEPFVPLESNKVRMYVCGITAYDYSHIGHARSAVVFDAIVRYLRFRGFDVRYVRNFTDVDDKIIRKALEENIGFDAVSKKYIAEYKKDMRDLDVLDPDEEPLATEHIADMIRTVQSLIDKGHAYESDGNVYFSVETFASYGKLSGRDTDEMLVGARVEKDENKKAPLDFALWKRAKPGEPHWTSPWGEGRPGWHIECSSMSTTILGTTLDIHGGGKDLIFPHHENEIAQAEAATGHPFVRFWIHNGFVNMNQEKMSKSLGNILAIREVLKTYHPEALRLFLLSGHYRSPLDYSGDTMYNMQTSVERVYNTFRRVDEACADAGSEPFDPKGAPEEALGLLDRLDSLEERFVQAMDDDFNTAQAIGVLFDIIKAMNRVLDMAPGSSSGGTASLLKRGVEEIRKISGVLGLFGRDWQDFFRARTERTLEREGLSPEEIERLLAERAEARSRKDWARADEIRQALNERGIVVEDTPSGAKWRVA